VWDRVDFVVLGVFMEVSESAEVDSGEWMFRVAVLGIIALGEAEPSGVVRERVRSWSVVGSVFVCVLDGVSVPGDCDVETDLTNPIISSEMRCQAEMVFR
jgi:hypothetical protein